MKGIVCKICGFIAIDGSAPDKCSFCGSPKSAFAEDQDAIKRPQDENKLTDLEKKHVPSIIVVKTCGLIPEGCQDVHVKMGEIKHPMLPEHYITRIDFYLDKKYISRVYLTPEKLNPAAALHLSTQSGQLAVIESCNVHGSWIKEVQL